MMKYPGLFDQTGGRTIPIRALIGLRFPEMSKRSPYKARIGDGVDREKGGSGLGVPGGVLWRGMVEGLPGISENFLGNFL
jgi:hypothetical protein